MEKKKNDETNYEEVEVKEETLEESEILEDQEFEGIDEEHIVSLEAVVEELQTSNKKLVDENTKLQNELNAVKDRLLRLTAEYENYRKRTAKEKEGIYTDACEDVLKNMFPVLDNLERAAAVNGSVEDIKKGIDMTIRQFKDSLEKLQVEEIPVDNGFDPNLHNAVMHIEDSNLGTNVIAEVFQKGYKRGDKVLRHSMVKVAN
ncbi:nucleotide exchange factor GrpE [Clostridium sp. SYSU_GA19001]|uniref:nucleotide exchange factor GrpE n=1 Tax=Clostridium caldaquaticum TaxID=2940653 RepID=UPI0020773488|nr:nucleotide exchange factor GrpE [Clostridium caldaquaticum]MCM8710401.1 nucleotide exchange factor GrpE [Clostridium caldaquaticum]